ncbi:MAG: TetR/AcrR family transcriptional regulator [Bacteroidota bacterium]
MLTKREKIIRAAIISFCEKGFQQTSTAMISKAAGVATGTLFLYFKSKDDLINVIYKESKMEMMASLQADFPEGENTQTIVKHIWIKAIEWAMANRQTFQFIHMCKASPIITDDTKMELAPLTHFGDQLLKRAFANKELAVMDSEMFYMLLDGMWTSTIDYVIANPTKNNKKVINHAFEIFWKGVSR